MPENPNNQTEIHDNRYGRLNLSYTLTQNNEKDTSAQEIICNEMFFNKKPYSKKLKLSNKVNEKFSNKPSEEGRSVISSDDELESSSNRMFTQVVNDRNINMFQSYSSKNPKAKRFVIRKSSVRGENSKPPTTNTSFSNYRVSKKLAGILEQQLQVLMQGKNQGKRSERMSGPQQEVNKSHFLPYKNAADLLYKHSVSKSQRSRRKLTVSTGKVKSKAKVVRSDNRSARSNYVKSNKVHTPRYNGNIVRLVKGKEQIINHHK